MVETKADLDRWLESFDDQTDGDASSVCETGERYVEFLSGGLARPGDEVFVENVVAKFMYGQLRNYFNGREGRIYWRIRLEWDVHKAPQILKIDVNGPDTDFVTGRRCVMDHNWVSVKCYCRLYKASLKTAALDAARKAA